MSLNNIIWKKLVVLAKDDYETIAAIKDLDCQNLISKTEKDTLMQFEKELITLKQNIFPYFMQMDRLIQNI